MRGVGGCAWINFDDGAPPVRQCMEPAATILDAWMVESMRTEKWYAARLPVNWKLAIEAFVEMYHVVVTHPQLDIPGMRYSLRPGAPFDPRSFIDAEIEYLREMSEGMDGMVHANDVRVAEGLRGMELPADPALAIATWNQALNDAVVRWYRERRADIPDLNELDAQGFNETFYQCFPHYFVLPMYSGASSYRFRPLGPEETLMEIWSLARFPGGEEPGIPTPAERVGGRRPTVAADPRAGLLEHPQAAEGPARQGLSVHAPERATRRPHLQPPADRRRLSRRPPLRAAAPGTARGQRGALRQAGPRPRLLTRAESCTARRFCSSAGKGR